MTDAEKMVYAVAFVHALSDTIADTIGGQAGWHHAAKAAHAVRIAHDTVEALRYAQQNATHYTAKYFTVMIPEEHALQAQVIDQPESAAKQAAQNRRLDLRKEYPVRGCDKEELRTLEDFLGKED